MNIDDFKDADWKWCGLCIVPYLKCAEKECFATTCNAGGCPKCTETFGFIIENCYRENPPQWFADLRAKMEKEHEDDPPYSPFESLFAE